MITGPPPKFHAIRDILAARGRRTTRPGGRLSCSLTVPVTATPMQSCVRPVEVARVWEHEPAAQAAECVEALV